MIEELKKAVAAIEALPKPMIALAVSARMRSQIMDFQIRLDSGFSPMTELVVVQSNLLGGNDNCIPIYDQRMLWTVREADRLWREGIDPQMLMGSLYNQYTEAKL